jgi:hypothetical protein
VADLAFVLSAGCRKEHDNGTCLERRRTNTELAVIWGGVGVGAVAAAILWYALDEPAESSQDLRLGVGPATVSLSGRF